MNDPIQIKTFRSKSLQDALQRIRQEFGPDAAVLETKPIRGGLMGFGRSRIEVTATNRIDTNRIESDDLGSPNTNESIADEDSNTNIETNDVPPSRQQELDDFENINPSFAMEPNDFNRFHFFQTHTDTTPPVAPEPYLPSHHRNDQAYGEVFQDLLEANIDRSLAMQWIEAARASFPSDAALDRWVIRATIGHWIRGFAAIAPPIDVRKPYQQVIAVMGPTGVGKTSTLLKLAATISLDHRLPIGIISSDTQRPGSNQLIERHASLMDWPVAVVESADQVRPAMDRLANCSIVFLDTPGCSPGNEAGIDHLNQIMMIAKPTIKQLVLSSTTNVSSFDRAFAWFASAQPHHLILTKLDESGGLGPLFNSILRTNMPVSFFSNGTNIPSDLSQATPSRFSQAVFPDAQGAAPR